MCVCERERERKKNKREVGEERKDLEVCICRKTYRGITGERCGER